MAMMLATSRISTRDPDRFDVTRLGAYRWARLNQRTEPEAPGHPFAPSWHTLKAFKSSPRDDAAWQRYVEAFVHEMRLSFVANNAAWLALLQRPRVVLVCFCPNPARCHRRLLVGLLERCGTKLGVPVVDAGEVGP